MDSPTTETRRRSPILRTVDLLGSGRLAVALLAVLVVLLLLYLFVPQFHPGERVQRVQWVKGAGAAGRICALLGFTDIRRSWWLAGAFALLFVNLLVCMVRRFRAAILLTRLPGSPPPSADEWPRRDLAGCRFGSKEIERFLRSRGYRTRVAGDWVYGMRGRFGVIGHWVFHSSLLLLLATGAVLAARPSPFRGTIGIGEGEDFDLNSAAFLGTNQPVSPDLPALRFTLDRVDVVTEGEEVRRFSARLSTPGGESVPFGINRPYRRRPYQVMVHGFGYMPGWVVVDGRGSMRRGAWIKLVPFPLEEEESFRIGPKTSNVHFRFHPDYAEEGGRGRSVTRELRNPRFRTRIELLGETVFEGLLEPGQRVPIGGDREFFFLPEIRRYLLVDVIREEGHGVVFSALGAMILGLFFRYARLRKEIVVRFGGEFPVLSGRCEILPNLFEEELTRMAADLGRHPGRPAGEGGAA